MEKTFNDLCNERKQQTIRGLFGFVLWMFVETGLGIIKEYILLMAHGNAIKNILLHPTSAAITGLILSLPLERLFLILNSDIELLIAPVESVLTVGGSQPNILAYTVICGGMLVLPVASVLNLRPMLKRAGAEGKRSPMRSTRSSVPSFYC